ncbi:DNA gyrase/topoisomerase IV, subunit A family protein, partial [Chlamydia psittaci 84-8471/1]
TCDGKVYSRCTLSSR